MPFTNGELTDFDGSAWQGPLTELGQELHDGGDIPVFADREVANATARIAELTDAGIISVVDGKIEVE